MPGRGLLYNHRDKPPGESQMPVIRRAGIRQDESNPDVERLTLVDAQSGSGYLTMGESTIAPAKKIPLHTHPTHEEGNYIMEDPLNYMVGDESGVVLARTGVRHELPNPQRNQDA